MPKITFMKFNKYCNILQDSKYFTIIFQTCQTSGKLVWTFWQSRRLLKITKKYFEASKTFQDLSNFRKVIVDILVF